MILWSEVSVQLQRHDCTAHIFDGFNKQELSAHVWICFGFASLLMGRQNPSGPELDVSDGVTGRVPLPA